VISTASAARAASIELARSRSARSSKSSAVIVYGNQPSPTRPARRTAGSLLPPRTIGTAPDSGRGRQCTRSNGREPTPIRGRGVRPQLAHGLDAFLQAGTALGVRRAHRGVLLLLPADPSPSIRRPSECRSIVATRFARTTGLCSGATTIAVPKRSVRVAPARNAIVSNGSGIGTTPAALGVRPESEYGYSGS